MKILVVEDDQAMATTLTSILSEQNYAVEVAPDGLTGWDLVQTYDFDLILLDRMLPQLDGIQFCQQLRSKGFQMPVLLLTGHSSSHEKAQGLDAGADDYLVKPFDPEELLARVRALLRRSGGTAQPILAWGHLSLDPSTHEMTYERQQLNVTPKEYALMELLLRNPRRVFSCGSILEHLWAYEQTPGEEAVRTHIKGLRQKLKASGAPDCIETVYGIGYRLKALDPIPTSLKADPAPPAATSTGVFTQIWKKYQPRIQTQVQVLADAAQAVADQRLTPDQLQQALQDAHSLAGSLGTFGFPHGSQLARQVEQLLRLPGSLRPTQLRHLQGWVEELSTLVQSPPDQDSTPDSSIGRDPLHQREGSARPDARILVVDDDRQMLDVVKSVLEPWGFRVSTLADPRHFRDRFPLVHPDLVILDVEMPHISGIELCQHLRQDPAHEGLPILFLTSHTDVDTFNLVFSAGADDFVTKPVVGPELVIRILNRLERIKLLQQATEQASYQRLNQRQEELRQTKDELELRVAERTAELVNLNRQLQLELEERKRAQEALRTSQVRLSGILDSADDAIISVDAQYRISLFNQGAERIFGYSTAEILGEPLDRLLPERFNPKHRQHMANFGQSESVARRMSDRGNIFGLRKDGTEFPAEASISQMDVHGEKTFTVILRDIGDRIEIERLKDEFISVVSHELRTPLTSIHGSLRLLASGLLDTHPEKGSRMLKIAVDSTERLIRLINDILDVERIESGRTTMNRQWCRVEELFAEAVEEMQATADKYGVVFSSQPLPLEIWADPDRILQILTNLLSNACKFSVKGGVVTLRAEQYPEHILFQVQDHGRGIPTEKQEMIFERFQQVDVSDSRQHDGTGLGLAICRSIVQQHGGTIWVESQLGVGSTFFFTVPFSPVSDPGSP